MRNPVKSYQEDPFFRSTINVIGVQALFGLLTVLIFAGAIQYQQYKTLEKINERRAALSEGMTLAPDSLDIWLYELRDDILSRSLIVLVVLALLFGYLSARYALHPTRKSLEYQKRFIGNIAHELRTPLSIIRTDTEVTLMDRTLPGDVRESLTLTIHELDRISSIINNLLSFDALMRPGRIRFEPMDVLESVHSVVARHRNMAHSYGIGLAVDAAEGVPAYINGNKVAIEQALTNLVKNALNYTPQHDGRSVVVRVDDKEEHIGVSVIDTGIGIAQKDLYYIFQPYYRGDTSRERGIGSGTSGLGLAIVNDIVRAHQGSIVIRSALNRGTTIELTLPKADIREQIQNVAQAEDDGQEHEERI